MDFVDYVRRHRAWSEQTFGKQARTAGLLAHIEKECKEIAQRPEDLEEWIDVIILAIDGACRNGHSDAAIAEMLNYKLEKNQKRQWVVSEDPTVPNEHVRIEEDFHL